MQLDRSLKNLIAITTLVAALFLAMNHIIETDPIEDWALAIALALVSTAFWVWLWLDSQEQAASALAVMAEQPKTPVAQPQEWIISKETPAAKAKAPAARAAKAGGQRDDLKVIEGIGPKYQQMLYDEGITTLEQLSKLGDKQLEAIVEKAGLIRPASLDTWAEQATYLLRGDEAGFKALVEQLKAGRRRG